MANMWTTIMEVELA